MPATGPRLRFTMYYMPFDEILQTQFFYGEVAGTQPVEISVNTQASLIDKMNEIGVAFLQLCLAGTHIYGFKVDSPDELTQPYFTYGTQFVGTRSGDRLPNNCILDIRASGAYDPPRPLPLQNTISSGYKISGMAVTDQTNGQWDTPFITNDVQPFIDAVENEFTIGASDLVLCVGGKDKQFTADQVQAYPVVSRNISRRANRSQGQRDLVTP